MAMLATKTPYPAQLSTSSTTISSSAQQSAGHSNRRAPAVASSATTFASPTESDFSDAMDGPDSAKNWDEERVCEWLRSVNCGDYEKLFRRNNINGENLLEMDKAVLQEIGIDKIGDRVRLFLGIKKLRTKAYANQKKRNRDSFAPLESSSLAYTPSSSGSPRPPNSGRTAPISSTSKRYSRQYESIAPASLFEKLSKPPSRPSSPQHTSDSQVRVIRAQRYNAVSPAEISRRENAQGYFNGASNPSSAATVSGRRPTTPSDPQQPQTARIIQQHTRGNGSLDASLMASLPTNQDMIRVISSGGLTKVVKITDCTTCDEVMRVTLRKFGLREDHDRNYCFYALAGVEPDPAACRRLKETELWRIVKDRHRPERNRLILRKIHAGEPGQAELQRASEIAIEEETATSHSRVLGTKDKRSQAKAARVLGEDFRSELQYPLSPASFQSGNSAVSAGERERNVYNAAKDLERPPSVENSREISRYNSRRKEKAGHLHQFFGARPPSELITSDLTNFFPDHSREEIDKTVRMSLRRSKRLSRMNSRLSVASNLSFTSSLRDAPPIPNIADTWLAGSQKVRPLDLTRSSSGGIAAYRDSIASSSLERVQEESPGEPNRKSYISFDSGSDTAAVNVTDPDGNVSKHSYFDGDSTEAGDSLRDISQALDEDGEDADADLQNFLTGEGCWDDNQWMKGTLIGQGSFGSVYLALHAVTGELLAVKQVEVPQHGDTVNDARKRSMIDALKREIGLLRELQHPNIVQYLGSSSSDECLNIFLEYVPGGSVQTMLNSYGALREPLVRSFVRQIVTGLAYLHSRDIIHRDIKGANILVDNKGGIKISDFGISKKVEASNALQGPGGGNAKNRSSLQGSVFWMAPEVVKQTSYTRKADIWSLGCLVIEMMTGNHPFPDCSQLQAIFKIGGAQATPTIPEHASPEAVTFLKKTFEIDFKKRPTADELLFSPFLSPCT